MNKKFFVITFCAVIFSFLSFFSSASAASISVDAKTSSATVRVSGAAPNQKITIYISNDPNLNKSPYLVGEDKTTDSIGMASAEFALSPNSAYRAYTSLGDTPSQSFTTPREESSLPVKQVTISSFSPKSGPVGTEISIVGTNFDNIQSVKIGDYSVIPKTNLGGLMTVVVREVADVGRFKIVIQTKNNGTATSSDYFEVTKSGSEQNNAPSGSNTPSSGSNSSNNSNKNIAFSGLVPKCNMSGSAIDQKTGQYATPCDFNYFMALINRLIKFFLFDIATPFLAIIIIYVAYLFLTSGGSNQTEKAKHVLWNVVIGYVIALAAWLIINTIISALGVTTDINTFMDRVDF